MSGGAPCLSTEASRDACRGHGVLLVLDEIWSGLGRSGRLFAFDHAGIAPDLVALGKGLSASLTLSAVAGRRDILGAWSPGAHTSTFMGNPLACAAAAATLRVLRERGSPRAQRPRSRRPCGRR